MHSSYECSFTVDNISYNCSEQFIQSRRCHILGQEVQAQKIMSTSDPSIQKKLGGSTRTDPTPWYDVAREKILPAIRAKFSQNPDLSTYLINTGTRDLGEASLDPFWGVGLSLNNKDIAKKELWTGKNVLGKVLMAVRADLVAQLR